MTNWPPPMPALPLWRRASYRVGQFVRGLTASVTPEERRQLAAWLSPPALALFESMPCDGQRHSLDVRQTLWEAGCTNAALLTAALLHDVGKSAAEAAGVRINLWLRGPLVVAAALAPELLARQGRDDPATGWRYALHVQLAHPAIGATMARQAGASALTCWLIAHHQDKAPAADDERRALLTALQWADDRN